MRHFKALTFGILGSLVYLLVSLALLFIIYFTNPSEKDTQIILWISLGFGVFGIINLIAVLQAPTNKFMRGVLLFYAIFSISLTNMLGIFNCLSYKYCRDYVREGDIPHVTLRERIRHRKERREEIKYLKKTDPEFANYLNYLKRRKARSILKAFFLLALSLLISVPGLWLYYEFLLVPLEQLLGPHSSATGLVVSLVPFIAYIVLCLIFLGINGVQIGFSISSHSTKVIDTYQWQESDILGFIDTSGYEKVDSKVEEKHSTYFFFSGKTLLFLIFGWLMFIPQTISLLIAIFTKYDSEYRVCGCRPERIPRQYIRSPYEVAQFTSFFFGFVCINYGYLDYMYEIARHSKRR